jgi:hypothetical protein
VTTAFVIGPRFQGPPGTAHGGTAAACLVGLLPAAAGGARVRLQRPVPLGRRLHTAPSDDGVDLLDAPGGEVLAIVRGTGGPPELHVPPEPVLDAARVAAAASPWNDPTTHPFPHCFGCGPLAPDDALHLRPGPLGDGRHACVWTPPRDVSAGLVLAALDCPSAGPTVDAAVPGPFVLGEIVLAAHGMPRPGEPHVVQSWLERAEGRRVHTGCALHPAGGGEPLAVAAATWVAVAAPS